MKALPVEIDLDLRSSRDEWHPAWAGVWLYEVRALLIVPLPSFLLSTYATLAVMTMITMSSLL